MKETALKNQYESRKMDEKKQLEVPRAVLGYLLYQETPKIDPQTCSQVKVMESMIQRT